MNKDKLNEECEDWEDYEEHYWFICTESGYFGIRHAINVDDDDFALFNKSIGNYFKTEEEAEKAVEKLKAWKRLKEKCNFRFAGIERNEQGMLKGIKVDYERINITFPESENIIKDLDLLFGGEDEKD